MFEALKKFFRRAAKKPEPPTSECYQPSPEIWAYLAKHGCLDCPADSFTEGASGGGSTNIKCTNCGSKYNLTAAIHWAERIPKLKKE